MKHENQLGNNSLKTAQMKTHLSIALIAIGSLFLSCTDDNITGTKKYRLSVSVNPTESGIVNPSSGEFEEGESVQITATPNQHWMFTAWEGDYTGTGSTVTIVMDRDKNISALFSKREYPLTIEIDGQGTVDERVVQQKTADYEGGTTVELTAVAAEGWHFARWQGDLEGSNNPVSILIDGEKSVTAIFEKTNYALTVNVVGEGAVAEEVVKAKSTDYPYQTVVSLTATASEGWEFSHWEGDVTGTENPAQITIDNNAEVTAVFVRQYYTITITYDGPGMTYFDLASGNQSDEGFEYESEVSIRVQTLSGWRFVSWEGDLSGTENPITVTVTGDITAFAVMEEVPFEGEGTLASPYLIATLDQLQMIAEPRFLDNHFKQVGDIDATATATWNNGQGFKPIGFLDTSKFTGSYDGGGFQINGLTINLNLTVNVTEFAVGLFGFVDHAHIKNLTLEDIDITGAWGVGGLAGNVGAESLLENVHVISGSIAGTDHVGGLAGYIANSEIIMATSQVSVEGNNNVGGLVGNAYSGKIHIARSYGDVTGIQNVGGLIGHQVQSRMVTSSYARGDIIGSINVGGLIGASFNTTEMIRFVFSTGNVTGNQNAGGLVGFYTGEAAISETYAEGNVSSTNGTYIGGLVGRIGAGNVYKSYASGDVSGSTAIGGLIGRNDPDGVIFESYSAGLVSGSLQVGGLIGSHQGVLNKSYWDTETSGQISPVWDQYQGVTAATGLTTSQMTGTEAQVNMPNFDWVDTWKTSLGYPNLKFFSTLE
jgi:hypothetical protein